MKDVIDALRPADAAAVADSLANQRQTVPAPSDNVGAVVVGQIQAMQNALKDDQELVVLCSAGLETLRVLEFFSPTPRVLVLTGLDTERTITRVICPVDTLAASLQAYAGASRYKGRTYPLCRSETERVRLSGLLRREASPPESPVPCASSYRARRRVPGQGTTSGDRQPVSSEW